MPDLRSLSLELSGLGPNETLLESFRAVEGLSRPFQINVGFYSQLTDLKASDFLGKSATVTLNFGKSERYFNGVVRHLSALGLDERGFRTYSAEIVPAFWLLTLRSNSRIFENKTTDTILQDVLRGAGFPFEIKVIGSRPTSRMREYCVQYRETDFNFVSRLMEEDGIFYFFRQASGQHTMVIADNKDAYEDCDQPDLAYTEGNTVNADVTMWHHGYEFISGKWTQNDYNFETPHQSLLTTTGTRLALANAAQYEMYDYPGAYETKSSGDALIKMRIEGEESSYEMVEALSVNATLKSGGRVTMSRHPIEGEAGLKYAIASVAHEAWWTAKTQGGGQGGNGASAAALATDAAKHFVHGQGGFVFGVSGAGGGFAASAAAAEGSDASRHLMATSLGKSMGGGLGGSLKNGADAGQGGGAQQNSAGSQPGAAVGEAIGVRFGHPSGYSARVVCLPGSTPFRPPRLTPKPMIHGLQTAVVTGPSGEEIYTDQYGRIKVLFFWDRGQQASCWIRVAQSIAGKQWGDFYLPRIGQEVVVSFLEGDPDRPLVTGSVYNAANMPPFPLPDNKTQTGYKTHSSVGGGSDQYNELRFEDKIGQEEVYFQAQKDYNRLVKHDDSLKVLHDQTIEITRNRTETVKEGDEKVTIEKGNRTHEITQGDDKLKVGHDRTVEIKNDNEITVDGERKVTIHKDDSLKVEGKHDVKVTKDASLDVEQGNRDVTVTMGDHSITVAMGKSDIKALQSIELTVGSNSIKIDQSGIKIEGLQISIEGSAQTEIKGALIDIKGGLVQIN